MKILLLISSMDAGGAETHLLTLATCLAEAGETVAIISSGGRLTEEIEKMGIKHITIRADASRPHSIPFCRAELSRQVKLLCPDIIHSHSRIWSYIAAPVAKRYALPLITTAHARSSAAFPYGMLSKWGDMTIAVSQDLATHLITAFSVKKERIQIIENGIDTRRFYPRAQPPTGPLIVFMSRLDRDCSGIALLLCQIAPALRSEYKNIKIAICGGGECLDELKIQTDKLCREANDRYIYLTGHIDDTPTLMREASLFVGVSRAAMEAMACGVPTLLFGNEGCLGYIDSAEVLRKAEKSNLCCRGEKQPTAEYLYSEIIKALRRNNDNAPRLRDLYANHIEKYHNARVKAKEVLALYRRTTETKRKGRVLLLGYYGYGNLGDNALLSSAIARARRKFPNDRIIALTRNGKKDSVKFSVECAQRYSPYSLLALLPTCHTLIFGGGTLFQDNTSLRSLLYYSLIWYIAHLFGLRTELWSNGLSPLKRKISKRILTYILKNASHVGLRDDLSLSIAKELLVGHSVRHVCREPDLSLPLPVLTRDYVRKTLMRYRLVKNERKINYAVIALKGDCPEGLQKLLRARLLELQGKNTTLVFLSMYPREDTPICQRYAKLFDGRIAESPSLSHTVALISEASVLLGMRYHALLFAKESDVPCIGFSTDPKIEAFCRENNVEYFYDRI